MSEQYGGRCTEDFVIYTVKNVRKFTDSVKWNGPYTC